MRDKRTPKDVCGEAKYLFVSHINIYLVYKITEVMSRLFDKQNVYFSFPFRVLEKSIKC